MVVSFPLMLKCPEIPSARFCWALAASEDCSALSGTFSTRPSPNNGVGIRNTTLLRAISPAKFGCWMLQPGASDLPVITNRACTLPSAEPSGLRTNLASRIGPLSVMKDGTTFLAPAAVATPTCGLLLGGLLPPIDGNE